MAFAALIDVWSKATHAGIMTAMSIISQYVLVVTRKTIGLSLGLTSETRRVTLEALTIGKEFATCAPSTNVKAGFVAGST
jgi:hypothetical protein